MTKPAQVFIQFIGGILMAAGLIGFAVNETVAGFLVFSAVVASGFGLIYWAGKAARAKLANE